MIAKLMVLHCQFLFSLTIAAIVEVILMWTSAEQVPSLHRVAPRYLKLVTSSNFWPFMLIGTNVVCAVGHDLALFCADIHSICRCFVYESIGEVLKVCHCYRPYDGCGQIVGFISAFHQWRWMCGGSVSSMIFSRNKLKWMVESKHP